MQVSDFNCQASMILAKLFHVISYSLSRNECLNKLRISLPEIVTRI